MMSSQLEHAIKEHYSGHTLTASRLYDVAQSERLEGFVDRCGGCNQTILPRVERRVLDGCAFHASCARKYEEARSRSTATAAPLVIGRLHGCAAPIGVQTQAWHHQDRFWFAERFLPAAFDDVRPGIVALKINHARVVPARFQTIQSEGRQLRFRAELYDSPEAHDTLWLVRAGAIRGVSVGLGSLEARYAAGMVREVVRCELIEISLITGGLRPAYADTWAALDR